MPGPTLSPTDQLLLTTLLVKLAVMAAAATIARAIPPVSALPDLRAAAVARPADVRPEPRQPASPLGVVARLLLGYQAADLTLEGAFLAGLIDGPYAGLTVGAMVGIPPLVLRRVHRPALRHRLRLRRRRPPRAVPQGRALAVLAVRLHQPARAAPGR